MQDPSKRLSDTEDTKNSDDSLAPNASHHNANCSEQKPAADKEIGGREGPDPVRYGDWELNGRCIDF